MKVGGNDENENKCRWNIMAATGAATYSWRGLVQLVTRTGKEYNIKETEE
jgi:hypothetical protein